MRAIDLVALQNVRKKDGLVAVYDVLRLVTAQEPNCCRVMWARLNHPELATICSQYKFNDKGRGSHQQTPAADARGVVHILMVLPGQGAGLFRMNAADVLVRYLGGDPELVTEVWANRRAQEELAREQPEHPARLFGEAVEAQAAGPLAVAAQATSAPPALAEEPDLARELALAQIARERAQTTALMAQAKKDDAKGKLAHLQGMELARQMRDAHGFTTNPRYQELARGAVNAAMLPPGESPDGMLDAAQYLHQVQGHNEEEVGRLAGEFGKWLKQRRLQERGEVAPTTTQDWGPEEREVHLYHREKDRVFLAASYTAFKERPLFARVCLPDLALQQRTRAALEGSRGMPKPTKKARAVTWRPLAPTS